MNQTYTIAKSDTNRSTRKSKAGDDPIQYNWGQVIQNRAALDPISNSTSESYKQKIKEKQKKAIHTIVCDWFSATIRCNYVFDLDVREIEISEGITLANMYQGSKHYENTYKIILHGELYGYLQVAPRNTRTIRGDRVQLKVDNRQLYTCDWLDNYKYILATLNWEHLSTTRLDIAIDNAVKGYTLAIKNRNGRTIKRKGKSKMHLRDISGDGLPHKVEIGSLHSDKYGKIYHKTPTLEKSNKEYIKQYWERNGLDRNGDYWRYEITLRSSIANNYDWQKVDDNEYLASVARTETKNWFEFYYAGKDKNKHRLYKNNSMEFIDWDCIKGDLLPKGEALHPTRVHEAKKYIKTTLHYNYIEEFKIETDIVSALVRKHGLQEWINKRVEGWYYDWDKELEMKKRFDLSNASANLDKNYQAKEKRARNG